MRIHARGLIVLVALAAVVSAVSVQAQDPRIGRSKLDAASSVALNAILDSAKAQGLPQQPLIERVYEGQAKGADGPRIVASVRALAFDMVTVQRALGVLASADELKAGASAMQVGVSPVELGKMKKESRLRSLVTPLTVLTDIVSRGVPVGTAVNAVKSLVGAGAKDKDINDFQRNVKDDIQQGAPPAAAAETRAKGASNGKPDTKSEKPPEQQIEQFLMML
jgi:hypothetical protein